MGKSDPGPKKYRDSRGDNKIREKYKTELISRSNTKEVTKQAYNTTPGDRFSSRNISDKQRQLDYENGYYCSCCSQFEYIRNNLGIKSCIGNREAFRFQMKKITIRNYTPKILRQEVNMGMWL